MGQAKLLCKSSRALKKSLCQVMSQAQALHIQLKPSSSLVKLGLAWLISTPTLPPFIFSYRKLLSMVSYGGELLLDSFSHWSGVFNHLSSFSIPLSFIFKKPKTPLMKKIQGVQALHGATSRCVYVFSINHH